MHGVRQLSWKSALFTGWIIGLAASAIAQSPGHGTVEGSDRAVILAQLTPRIQNDTRQLERESADAWLDELDDWLARAYFNDVLRAAKSLRASASLTATTTEARARRARLEVIAGTAHIALGAAAAAHACFVRALQASPELELDARSTPPKVLRALSTARSAVQSAAARAAGDRPPRLIEGRPPVAETSSVLRPTILCRLHVDANGTVVEAMIPRPRRELARFEALALAAVRDYRFAPAQRDGKPVPTWIHWPVQF